MSTFKRIQFEQSYGKQLDDIYNTVSKMINNESPYIVCTFFLDLIREQYEDMSPIQQLWTTASLSIILDEMKSKQKEFDDEK